MKINSIDTDANLAYLEEARGKEPRGKKISAPPEEDFQIIGSLKPRVDGRLIVTGKALYTHDLSLDKLLYGKVLRSPYAAAEVVSIDLHEAQNLLGVQAVLQLKEGLVKYEGEPVAAVAAASEKIAEEAARLIKVEYKRLPHVVSPEKAREESTPRVHESGNVEKFNEYSRGDPDRGFAEADVVIERTYKTAVEIHHPAETHVSMAKWDGDLLTVWDSTQAIFSVRDGLARALHIPASKVRVIKMYMGGGFGSKLGVNDHTVIAARLARNCLLYTSDAADE